MVSREKFEAYVKVQESGMTNMFDIFNVRCGAQIICNIDLTKEDCIYIMKNYKELKEKMKNDTL